MYDPKKPSTKSVLKLIKSTWNTPYLEVKSGTYATFVRKFNYPEIDHTDGIGTKGIYHWNKKTFKSAVLDSLAMNLNDLLLVRARAYKLQNHLVLPKDDSAVVREIVKSLVKECRDRQIAITGGETSIHNTPDSFDIGITISGFIKKPKPNKAKTGDVIVGLKSSGLHSNGFTLIRKLFGMRLRKEFIEPTKIYYDDLIDLVEKFEINGMMHITGGAFSKLKGIIDDKQKIEINNNHSLFPQKIFSEIFKKGISNKKMYTTFNCGIGFVMTLPESEANKILKKINYTEIIGKVVKGEGEIVIYSKFDNKRITI